MRANQAVTAVVLLALGCDGEGTDQPEGECRRGATMSCELAGGCEAERRCEGQPAEWGRCRCADPGPAEPDAGPAESPRLGARCEDDGDCPRGANCLQPDASSYFGGAPPGGLCVADCSEDAAACASFQDAVCVDVRERARGGAGEGDDDAGVSVRVALCFERCSVGGEAESKCHGRDDVACEALQRDRPSAGFCRPLCATDADCPGRSCDVRSGACVDAPPLDYQSFGQACAPDAGAGDCDGLCVSLTDDYAACGQRCAFGQPGDCAPLPSAPPRGGCLYTSPQGTIGDIGFCAELCDCDVDCSNPDAICDGFTDAELRRVFGRGGVCTAQALAVGEALRCD